MAVTGRSIQGAGGAARCGGIASIERSSTEAGQLVRTRPPASSRRLGDVAADSESGGTGGEGDDTAGASLPKIISNYLPNYLS